MLKTFTIKQKGKNSDRLVEAVKHEIRKYIKREKRKPLPEDAKGWHCDCRFAREGKELEVIDFKDITKNIDESASNEDSTFVIEILARPYIPEKKEKTEETTEENSKA
ncbi:MAG: DUF6172 family protein [Campylobacterales bacterium]|nr:DUF6172 family protein [Campylobacterales bacterium]